MNIIIAGAGAMGSRFGIYLHKAGNKVVLIDGWQAHIDAIREHGLRANLNGEEVSFKIPIYHQDEVAKLDMQADLIVLFTKAMQLDKMLQSLKPLMTENTQCLCLLNGIGHEDVVKKYVSLENILLGNTMWTAGLEGPGKAKLFGSGTIDLQSLGSNPEEASKEIVQVLSDAGLNAKYVDNIRNSIYKKACVNGTMNGLCTILESNMADFGKTTPATTIVDRIVSEFLEVGSHEGVNLDKQGVIDQIVSCFNPDTIGLHHPSMHQDLIANNRLTEIDYINGAISRKGKEYGVATPYCDFLTALIHCKEQILGAK